MNAQQTRRYFLVSITLKGLDGIAEIVGGLALYVISTATLQGWVRYLTLGELSEDPKDFIATYLRDYAAQFSVDKKHFFAAYLLIHGLVKIVLVYGLLRDRRWAFPTSLVVLTGFLVYQAYELVIAPGILLALLTIFDMIVVWLIWQEWQMEKHRRADGASGALSDNASQG